MRDICFQAFLSEIKFFIKKADDFEIKAKNPEIIKHFEEIKKILKGENWV